MLYPPLFLWLVAVSLVLDGLLLSRFPCVDRFLARLPLWLCGLLVLAWCLVVYGVFSSSFSGLVIQVH